VTESGHAGHCGGITEYVDAAAPGIGPADFIFVFGTRFAEPARIASRLYFEGLGPTVVLTGGANRLVPGLIEADVHARLLAAAGVPATAVIVERQSRNTFENVALAGEMIQPVIEQPETAIAVVKWHHRRAVLLLARNIPSLRRIFTVTYEPPDPVTGRPVTRGNWPELDADRVRREYDAIHALLSDGRADDLAPSGHGWMRS
jgi:uncharacterized SAM-binding protein YcdF (DUF218 family)